MSVARTPVQAQMGNPLWLEARCKGKVDETSESFVRYSYEFKMKAWLFKMVWFGARGLTQSCSLKIKANQMKRNIRHWDRAGLFQTLTPGRFRRAGHRDAHSPGPFPPGPRELPLGSTPRAAKLNKANESVSRQIWDPEPAGAMDRTQLWQPLLLPGGFPGQLSPCTGSPLHPAAAAPSSNSHCPSGRALDPREGLDASHAFSTPTVLDTCPLSAGSLLWLPDLAKMKTKTPPPPKKIPKPCN